MTLMTMMMMTMTMMMTEKRWWHKRGDRNARGLRERGRKPKSHLGSMWKCTGWADHRRDDDGDEDCDHYGDGDVGDIVGMVEQIIIVMVILMLMTWVVILAMMEWLRWQWYSEEYGEFWWEGVLIIMLHGIWEWWWYFHWRKKQDDKTDVDVDDGKGPLLTLGGGWTQS